MDNKWFWLFWITMLGYVIFLVLMSCCSGCNYNKSKMFLIGEPNDSNTPAMLLEGKPAETMSEVMAVNFRSGRGRENVLFDSIVRVAAPLLLLFVGGLIFWGITRSKWGWVIPSASAGGLGLIAVFTQAIQYIIWGIVGLSFLVIIWKAYEYQKERNILIKKTTSGGVQ